MVLNEKLFDTSLLTEIQPFETIKPDVFRSYMQQKPALLSQIHYSIRKIQLVFTKMVSGIEKEPKICPNCMTYKQKDAFNTPGTATSSGSKQSPSNLAVPLLENYKQIIKSQNQLLTKMKLKSQNFL